MTRKAPLRRRRPRRLRKPDPAKYAPDYLAWVRTLPCAACGAIATAWRPNQAHHTGPRGLGTKSSDFSAVPLCAGCHDDGHARVGMKLFAARYDFPALVARLNAAWRLLCTTIQNPRPIPPPSAPDTDA